MKKRLRVFTNDIFDYSRPYAPTGAGRLDDDENDYSKISEHLRVHVAGC